MKIAFSEVHANKISYVFGSRFDDKDGRFMLLHPVEESRHTAAVFFSRVQQFRLVHCDAHW